MPDDRGFPVFPTAFTETDVERLRQLEEQRKSLERAYKVKFAEKAWAGLPVAERAVRRITPPWLAPVVGLLPGEAETFEYGFTPEQFQERVQETEEEFKELVRKQKVAELLPAIQTDLTLAALRGELAGLSDPAQLKELFPELKTDFTEEEIGYFARVAQTLMGATPEQILSGELFAYEPMQLPVSREDYEMMLKEGIYDPTQVRASIEFISTSEEIIEALKQMYAPRVEKVEASEEMRRRMEEQYRQRAVELGILPEGEEPSLEAIKEYHRKAAVEGGESLALVNEFGEMFSATRRADNTVWIGDELIGAYDENTGKIAPFDAKTGKLLFTEEEKESSLKDLMDSFYLGLSQAWYGARQAIFGIIPQTFFQTAQKLEEKFGLEKAISPHEAEAIARSRARTIQAIREGMAQREAVFQGWLKEHPEYAPKPEYTQNPLEHPELFLDPFWYGHIILSNAPILATALAVGVATTTATKNPWAGAAAGAAVITPVEINSVYEDLIANGADPANAAELATSMGTVIGAVEIIPGMIALKAVAPAFMGVFRKNFQRELSGGVVKQLSRRGILATATKIEVAEVTEEIIQEALQNAAVMTVNENRSLVENLPRVGVEATIAVLPLAFLGGMGEYTNMKRNLPPEIQKEIDVTSKELQEAGLSEEHAEAVALSQLLETETGQAQVEEAAEKVEVAPPVPEKITKLEGKVTAVNEEIAVIKSSIEVHQNRLDKMELLPDERQQELSLIKGLEDRLAELEKAKVATQKNIDKARKVVEVPAVPEVAPEVTEPAVPMEEPVEPERPLAPDRRPKLREWGDEETAVREALDRSPVIASKVVLSNKVKEARETAKNTLNRTQDEFDLAKVSGDKEAIKDVETRLKTLAKEAGLRAKTFLGKWWDDLPPTEQADLALSAIPDRSITLPKILEIADVKHYVRFLEEQTGLPFYQLYPRISQSFGASQRAGELILHRLKEDPELRQVKTSKEAQVRVTQEINSKNPRLNVPPVEDLTEEEHSLVNTVEDILRHYEPYVRYLRVMATDSDMESFKTEFPDAVEAGKESELQVAIDLKEAMSLDDLFFYLKTVDWGTVTGYTPWMKAKASIFPKQIRLGTTRGEARLMQRTSIDFDETLGETLLLDVVRYVKQIEAQWRLRPELEMYDELWKKAASKFVNRRRVEETLKKWGKELQGMPVEGSLLDDIINRTWKQSMSTVFVHLYMSIRNVHQPISFHPDRTELARLSFQDLPPALGEKAKIFYDNFVGQLGGLRMDFLLAEGKGLPGLNWLSSAADSVSLYAHSDNIPRLRSFLGSTNKAWRATQAYKASKGTAKDLDKWIRKSGAVHLTQTEKNYALQLLAQGDDISNLAISGLGEVSGYEAVSFYIGHEMADITHFLYRRAFRAPAEMGSTGRLLYNLIVFPRGYVQRIVLQSQKIFGKEATWGSAAAGFKDIILLFVIGTFISTWLMTITGRRRKAYNPLTIIQWQLGGLAIGIGLELTEMFANLFTYIDLTADKEDRNRALGKLGWLLESGAQTLVPFYRYFTDAIEAAAGVESIGMHTAVRELRGLLDKKYKVPEIEEIERNTWEKIRKAVLGGEVQDPTKFKDIQTRLIDDEARLGERDATGRSYTIGDFGRQVESSTKPLPDYLLLEQYGFSPRTVFYFDCRDKWEELYRVSSKERTAWREEHILEEAMLLFWEKYSKSVFRKGTAEGEEVIALVRMWDDLYNIDRAMRGGWTTWETGEIPLPEE